MILRNSFNARSIMLGSAKGVGKAPRVRLKALFLFHVIMNTNHSRSRTKTAEKTPYSGRKTPIRL